MKQQLLAQKRDGLLTLQEYLQMCTELDSLGATVVTPPPITHPIRTQPTGDMLPLLPSVFVYLSLSSCIPVCLPFHACLPSCLRLFHTAPAASPASNLCLRAKAIRCSKAAGLSAVAGDLHPSRRPSLVPSSSHSHSLAHSFLALMYVFRPIRGSLVS